MILVIAVIIFLVGMLRGNEWTHMLLTAIAIAVAAIPEGLPAISTIIPALGTQKWRNVTRLFVNCQLLKH